MKVQQVIVTMVVVSTLFSSMTLGSAYSEDFSTEPNWITNDPNLFYWNSGSETYAATQVNVNGGGNYSYYDVGHDGGSFTLEWDIVLHSVGYASDLSFGVFDPDLDTQSASMARLGFTRADEGLFVFMDFRDADGNSSYTKTPADQFEIDTLYHVVMEYDDSAGMITADVTTDGNDFTSLSLSGLSSLGSDVGYIGSSNVRAGNFQVNGAQTVGEFDNVSFVPEPAMLSLLMLGGMGLIRRRHK